MKIRFSNYKLIYMRQVWSVSYAMQNAYPRITSAFFTWNIQVIAFERPLKVSSDARPHHGNTPLYERKTPAIWTEKHPRILVDYSPMRPDLAGGDSSGAGDLICYRCHDGKIFITRSFAEAHIEKRYPEARNKH